MILIQLFDFQVEYLAKLIINSIRIHLLIQN